MKKDEKMFLYYFSFSQNIGNLLIARNVKITVAADYSGIIVPEKAVKTKDGLQGVYVRQEKSNTFVPVEILIKDDGYAIIKAQDDGVVLHDKSEIIV